MVDIEYVILFTNVGIPIYSYKLNKNFELGDDILFSAFLASLNKISGNIEAPNNLMLENKPIKIQYSKELKLSMIEMEDINLVFYDIEESEVIVGIGVGPDVFSGFTSIIQISQLMSDIQDFMSQFEDINWGLMSEDILYSFDNIFLPDVIHNYVEPHSESDECFLDVRCPYRW